MSKKKRLDIAVFEQGYAPSREKAKAVIMAGQVYVNNQKVDKAGFELKEDDVLEVRGNTLKYVSRGGLKLEKAMQCFPIDISGKICMDVGASTGGFTDCMLMNGASKVYSIDVGYGQLAWKLRCDDRVVNLERTNFRYVDETNITDKIDFASVDVSFISLKLIFPNLHKFLKPGGKAVCLIKPQFEAGKADIGKNGIVKNKKVHIRILREMMAFIQSLGLSVQHLDISSIAGRDGNREYVLHVSKRCAQHDFDLKQIVEKKIENRW